MQLRTARLCLDCEEVHDAQRCPSCASETFTFLTRWVPAPERRTKPRPTTSPEAEVYKHLLEPQSAPSPARRLIKQGVVGLTAVGLASWLLRRKGSGGGLETRSGSGGNETRSGSGGNETRSGSGKDETRSGSGGSDTRPRPGDPGRRDS